jgi:hypothetical protein
MARFRLRYRSTDLDLSIGDFVIGRSSKCSLALADALVSRRHAVLQVSVDEVVAKDLGSRNGVVVNGLRIETPRELEHMDRIFIGAEELLFIDAEQITDRIEGARYVVCDSCGAISGAAKRHCGDCGRRLDPVTGATSRDWSNIRSTESPWSDDTRPVRRLEVIGGIAAKAIRMGRIDEAERVLLPHLDELLERAIARNPLTDSEDESADVLLERATEFAMSLARGPRGTAWIDWVFRIHAATERVMSSETVDALHDMVRKLNYHNPRYLNAYLEVLRRQVAHCTSAERFVVGRILGLGKVVDARRSATGM